MKNTDNIPRCNTSKNLLPRKSTIPEASVEEESNKSDSILMTSPRKLEKARPRRLTLHVQDVDDKGIKRKQTLKELISP